MQNVNLGIVTLLATTVLLGQSDSTSRAWNEPVKPFQVIGNIYYVGASDLTSFLITSPGGHILIDGGLEQTAPQILANIRTLGFKPEDVKVLLISQAHYDHAGGLAELKRRTGAKLFASQLDGELLARGGKQDFGFGDRYPYPPVKPDAIVTDGQPIRAGTTTITAHLTPGHTKGCTSFTMKVDDAGKPYNVLWNCSTSVPGYNLVSMPAYPNIISDYERSFAKLRALPCDVPLAAHGSFFGLSEKRKHAGSTPNPFIDPQGCREMLESSERTFRSTLANQRK
jgi:metallo-beta-lactamase class B